jgi:pilus assembly protein CpaF
LAGLTPQAVHSQVSSALHAVIHLTRDRTGLRRIAEIRVIARARNGSVTTHPAVHFTRQGTVELDTGAPQLTHLLSGAAA